MYVDFSVATRSEMATSAVPCPYTRSGGYVLGEKTKQKTNRIVFDCFCVEMATSALLFAHTRMVASDVWGKKSNRIVSAVATCYV